MLCCHVKWHPSYATGSPPLKFCIYFILAWHIWCGERSVHFLGVLVRDGIAEQESVRKFDKCHGGYASDVDIVQW